MPRLLDGGCKALMLPHPGLAHYGASNALRNMRYAPHGDRPTCTGVPAANFGLAPFPAYVERANDEIAVIGLVEDKECIEKIDSVLDDGLVDCVMPGPGDLSVSYGVHGQFQHPLVGSAVTTVLDAAKRKGIAAGLDISDPSEVAAGVDRGIRMFVLSIDYKLLGATLRSAATRMREQVH